MPTSDFVFDDITDDWLREHAELVEWDAPLYCASECVHVGIVQARNSAGRRDPRLWFVVVRQGMSSSGRLPLHCVSNGGVSSYTEAATVRQKYYDALVPEKSKWSTKNPHLQQFLSSGRASVWMDSYTQEEAIIHVQTSEDSAVCIQPIMSNHSITVAAWCPDNVQHTFFVHIPSGEVVNVGKNVRVSKTVRQLASSRPGIVFVGILHQQKETFSVYDALLFRVGQLTMNPRSRFAEDPLIDRLMHIDAIINVENIEHLGARVRVAPFQPAFSKHDIDLHTKIFIQSCQFPKILYRFNV